MKIPALLAAVALHASTPSALAQEPRVPSYRWVEASYGGQVISADNFGVSSRDTVRLAANVGLAPHLYLLGSYTHGDYPATPVEMTSAGVGTYVPLFGMHGILQLTYEAIEGDFLDQDGFGVEAGLRWATDAVEFGLAAEYSLLETDDFGGGEDRVAGVKLAGTVPITSRFGITVRMERLIADGDISDDVEYETYLVGVRLRF